MSILKYFSVILVALTATVCQAEIAIAVPHPEEPLEHPSAPSGATPEPSALKVTPLRLAIDFLDGSYIIGVPSITSVPVQTSYAKMEIPLKQILSMEIGEDRETISIDLQNGDKLKGVLDLKPLELETIFGEITVSMEHILRVEIHSLRANLVLHYAFDEDEGALDAFTVEQPGSFLVTNGKAAASAYGSEKSWYGPKATLPINVQGDFRFDASINYQTEGRQMGKITLGVALESGTILQFIIADSHTSTVEHSLAFLHGDKSVWASGVKKSNKKFSGYPIAIERRGNILRCLAGDQLVGTNPNSDESAVSQVFFTIKRYENYPVLTEASIGRIDLSRLNK
jgi:hypothetical protein